MRQDNGALSYKLWRRASNGGNEPFGNKGEHVRRCGEALAFYSSRLSISANEISEWHIRSVFQENYF